MKIWFLLLSCHVEHAGGRGVVVVWLWLVQFRKSIFLHDEHGACVGERRRQRLLFDNIDDFIKFFRETIEDMHDLNTV